MLRTLTALTLCGSLALPSLALAQAPLLPPASDPPPPGREDPGPLPETPAAPPRTVPLTPNEQQPRRTPAQQFQARTGMTLVRGDDGTLIVREVREESDASKAGIKPGDKIVAIDDLPVDDNAAIQQFLNESAQRQWFPLKIERGAESLEFVLGDHIDMLGMTIVDDDSARPVIRQLEPQSPATAGGFEAGDIITGVNGREIKSVQQLEEFLLPMLQQASEGQEIQFRVLRGDKTMDLTVVRPETVEMPLAKAPPETPERPRRIPRQSQDLAAANVAAGQPQMPADAPGPDGVPVPVDNRNFISGFSALGAVPRGFSVDSEFGPLRNVRTVVATLHFVGDNGLSGTGGSFPNNEFPGVGDGTGNFEDGTGAPPPVDPTTLGPQDAAGGQRGVNAPSGVRPNANPLNPEGSNGVRSGQPNQQNPQIPTTPQNQVRPQNPQGSTQPATIEAPQLALFQQGGPAAGAGAGQAGGGQPAGAAQGAGTATQRPVRPGEQTDYTTLQGQAAPGQAVPPAGAAQVPGASGQRPIRPGEQTDGTTLQRRGAPGQARPVRPGVGIDGPRVDNTADRGPFEGGSEMPFSGRGGAGGHWGQAGFVMVIGTDEGSLVRGRFAGLPAGRYVLAVHQFGDFGDMAQNSAGTVGIQLGVVEVDQSGRGMLQQLIPELDPQLLLGRIVALHRGVHIAGMPGATGEGRDIPPEIDSAAQNPQTQVNAEVPLGSRSDADGVPPGFSGNNEFDPPRPQPPVTPNSLDAPPGGRAAGSGGFGSDIIAYGIFGAGHPFRHRAAAQLGQEALQSAAGALQGGALSPDAGQNVDSTQINGVPGEPGVQPQDVPPGRPQQGTNNTPPPTTLQQ